MTIDKDLFFYDLAIVAILKDEGHYLKEWLDYHLLAGVDHFYLYDNDSTDNQAEVAKPYIEAGLVDYFHAPGKLMQYAVYNDAVNKFRFYCRYIAFIDLDEFIYPKDTTSPIAEILDEILHGNKNAAGLSIHWQCFGSNGQEKADYSIGVLERFTRRSKKDFNDRVRVNEEGLHQSIGNNFFKSILNPRRIKRMHTHYAIYFEGYNSVDENGEKLLPAFAHYPVVAEKIVLNHYFIKSREEFNLKRMRGRAYSGGEWSDHLFEHCNRNEEFDDGILKYRAARAEKFFLESNTSRLSRVTNALNKTLSAYANDKISDLETAFTCRLASHYLDLAVYEEASLAAILKSLNDLKFPEIQLLMSELPNLLSLPYASVDELRKASIQIIRQTMDFMREKKFWDEFSELDYLCRLLQAWR